MYTPEQIRVLLETAKADRLHALWYLAVSTGLRRSELAGLKWEDIDPRGSQPVLMVRRTRTMAANRVVDSTPKTRAGRRTIVLDQGTASLLVEHRELMASEAESAATRTPPITYSSTSWASPTYLYGQHVCFMACSAEPACLS